MAKELTIRIKIHHGKVSEPVDDDSPEGLTIIIAKVIAAIVAVLAIIIVILPDDSPVSDPKSNQQEVTHTQKSAIEKQKAQIAVTTSSFKQPPEISITEAIQNPKVVANSTKPKQKSQTSHPNTKPYQVKANKQLITTQFTSGIKKLKPIDNLGRTIKLKNNNTSKIYYHTVIEGQKGKKLTHRWIYNGKTVANISSQILQDRQIMHSSKTVSKYMTGKWSVQIVDQQNNTMKSDSFTLVIR